jgi:hypothetical protein
MTWINTITNDPNQSITFKLVNGEFVYFTLRYSQQQSGWYYSLTYGNFTVNNRRLIVSPSMLRLFRGILPFNIGIVTNDLQEVVYVDDFSNGRAKFFLMDSTDTEAVEGLIENAQV